MAAVFVGPGLTLIKGFVEAGLAISAAIATSRLNDQAVTDLLDELKLFVGIVQLASTSPPAPHAAQLWRDVLNHLVTSMRRAQDALFSYLRTPAWKRLTFAQEHRDRLHDARDRLVRANQRLDSVGIWARPNNAPPIPQASPLPQEVLQQLQLIADTTSYAGDAASRQLMQGIAFLHSNRSRERRDGALGVLAAAQGQAQGVAWCHLALAGAVPALVRMLGAGEARESEAAVQALAALVGRLEAGGLSVPLQVADVAVALPRLLTAQDNDASLAAAVVASCLRDGVRIGPTWTHALHHHAARVGSSDSAAAGRAAAVLKALTGTRSTELLLRVDQEAFGPLASALPGLGTMRPASAAAAAAALLNLHDMRGQEWRATLRAAGAVAALSRLLDVNMSGTDLAVLHDCLDRLGPL